MATTSKLLRPLRFSDLTEAERVDLRLSIKRRSVRNDGHGKRVWLNAIDREQYYDLAHASEQAKQIKTYEIHASPDRNW